MTPENKPPQRSVDHLIPHANRLLGFTARTVWKGMKGLVGLAFRLPGLFIRLNAHKDQRSAPTERSEK